eukprot:scaffold9739_cov117-Skeletonema_marinoi.AAC.5
MRAQVGAMVVLSIADSGAFLFSKIGSCSQCQHRGESSKLNRGNVQMRKTRVNYSRYVLKFARLKMTAAVLFGCAHHIAMAWPHHFALPQFTGDQCRI